MMPARLELQRKPGRYHTRKNFRAYQRGYDIIPHIVWGDRFNPVADPPGDDPSDDDLPGHPETASIPVVEAFANANPHLAADLLAHERARGAQARVTLVAWLEAFVDAHDGP